jgi:hypothetical protein
VSVNFGDNLVEIFVNLLIKDVVNKLIRRSGSSFGSQQLTNSFSDSFDLALNEISIEFDLTLSSSRDDLNKDSKIVSVFGFDVNRDVNQSSSFSNGLLGLISGQFELIERSYAVISLNILNVKFDFLGQVLNIFLSVFDITKTDL